MANLYMREEWVDRTSNIRSGDSDVYETFTDDKGTLYKHCVKEHGRCIGRVYIDTKDGSKPVGWLFLKKAKYEDTGEPYLLETWVTLHSGPPERKTTYHYADLK